jgi:hypothetical protein
MSTDPVETFQQLTLRFIATEIKMGFTLANVPATESAQGRLDRAHEMQAKAEQAYSEAERRLVEARERGWEIGILREHLRDLRNRLDDNEGEARKAA